VVQNVSWQKNMATPYSKPSLVGNTSITRYYTHPTPSIWYSSNYAICHHGLPQAGV